MVSRQRVSRRIAQVVGSCNANRLVVPTSLTFSVRAAVKDRIHHTDDLIVSEFRPPSFRMERSKSTCEFCEKWTYVEGWWRVDVLVVVVGDPT